ncbi:MAG TPA: FAD-dependent oxidoreductase [Saprospiraceae bacterium]|nr:FAD-dependent oxidoreductase [Saprospiraceae bacterium]HMQ83266.1 FAD-dependent oxidoreductase [Saprospiraceae bacterium]
MKRILILGAGTAGTMMANHLSKKQKSHTWEITIVDEATKHYYQPGFLFLPFGTYSEKDIERPIRQFLPKSVNYIQAGIDRIVGDENLVLLQNGQKLNYDLLIIATGTQIAPDEVEGMLDNWQEDVFDFYTFEGARALREKLANWKGGRLVVHISEMPIKCPVAPLEFAFLADDFFQKKGMRDRVSISYVTPMSGAFTKPTAAKKLGHLLDEKNIEVVSDFAIARVDNEHKKIIDYGGQEVGYDLLVTVPPNLGNPCIARSDMGDDYNFVPTDKHTLQSKAYENIFVLGDATNLPTSKAGSVAHFQAEILTENILLYLEGKALKADFDGHANCFVETGKNKALLIDFNYEQEPVTGTFPIPGVGPLQLLKESRLNHWGKLAFRWIYWNMLLPARPLPFVTPKMKTAGKNIAPVAKGENKQVLQD